MTELTDKTRTNREISNANLKPFKKGEVRNPSGRPPNKRYISEILRDLLDTIPKGEVDGRNADYLIALALLRKALGGDLRAIELTMDRVEGKIPDKHLIEGDIPVSIIYKKRGE